MCGGFAVTYVGFVGVWCGIGVCLFCFLVLVLVLVYTPTIGRGGGVRRLCGLLPLRLILSTCRCGRRMSLQNGSCSCRCKTVEILDLSVLVLVLVILFCLLACSLTPLISFLRSCIDCLGFARSKFWFGFWYSFPLLSPLFLSALSPSSHLIMFCTP